MYIVPSEYLTNIADSIRDSLCSTEEMFVRDMPNAIHKITANCFSPRDTWYRSTSMDKSQITSIEFLDTYTPTSTQADEEWYADLHNTGSILCYRFATTLKITNNRAGEKIRLSADCKQIFANMTSLLTISGLDQLDTIAVTIFEQAFYHDTFLQTLDLSTWNFVNAKNCRQMFLECKRITNIQLNESLTLIDEQMFKRCLKLSSISGLAGIKRIGARAFIYTPELTAIDIDVDKLEFIGESGLLFSSIEDAIINGNGSYEWSKLLKEDSGVEVQPLALRAQRWDGYQYNPNNNAQTIPQGQGLTIPYPDNQDLYYNYVYGIRQNGQTLEIGDVSGTACMSFAIYHIFNFHHSQTPYRSWLEWWNKVIEVYYRTFHGETAVFLGENLKLTNSDSEGVLNLFLSACNLKCEEKVNIDDDRWLEKKEAIKTLVTNYPTYFSIPSPNLVNGYHAIVVAGYDENTDKFAIYDSGIIDREKNLLDKDNVDEKDGIDNTNDIPEEQKIDKVWLKLEDFAIQTGKTNINNVTRYSSYWVIEPNF